MPLNDIPPKFLDHPETARAAMEAQSTTDANRHKSGLLGGVFGVGENATINYVGVILLLIVFSLLAMGVADFMGGSKAQSDFSKYSDIWSPIITTLIGFIIGQKTSSGGSSS